MGPLAILGLVGTVASGVGRLTSQRGQTVNNNAQIDYRNRARLRAYNDQMKIRNHNILTANTAYNLRKTQYAQTILNIEKGVNDAFLNEQLRTNEEFKAALFKSQGALADQVRTSGKLQAKLQSGGSSARAVALNKAAYGRNAAIMEQSLRSKGLARQQRENAILRRANQAQDNAYAQVAIAPTFAPAPSAPEMIPYNTAANNTNMLGTALGVAGSIATAAAGVNWSGGGGSNPGDALKIGGTDWGSMNTSYYSGGFSSPF